MLTCCYAGVYVCLICWMHDCGCMRVCMLVCTCAGALSCYCVCLNVCMFVYARYVGGLLCMCYVDDVYVHVFACVC